MNFAVYTGKPPNPFERLSSIVDDNAKGVVLFDVKGGSQRLVEQDRNTVFRSVGSRQTSHHSSKYSRIRNSHRLSDHRLMNKSQYIAWAAVSLILLFSVGCAEDNDTETIADISMPVPKPVTALYEHVTIDDGGTYYYNTDLGSAPRDVYFIFTNPDLSNKSSPATISTSVGGETAAPSRAYSATELQGSDDLIDYARKNGIGLRGSPMVTHYNANPPLLQHTEQSLKRITAPEPAHLVIVGDSHTFMNESTQDTIRATLRKVNNDGTIALNVWVADDAWGACTKSHCLNQAMVDAYAEKFLKTGATNDIYDWVTGIFGKPWGDHNYDNDLIDAAAAQAVDILFFDIDGDGERDPDGGVLGFFWSKDNLKGNKVASSNERLMFYMDSVLSAKPSGDSWDISDDWPAEMVSTLAHEFQHMIHYYQKTVLQTAGIGTETWLNEMASMITEDLLADKLQVNGPRGINYADGTAGSASSTDGRLPLYNRNNFIGVVDWYSGSAALSSYAINYAFGAYLARNFGGAELFRHLVQNQYTDYRALEDAVQKMGYTETLSTLLQKWGVAALCSNVTTMDAGYQYNQGDYFSSTLDGVTYQLGSINLYRYYSANGSGPYFFTAQTLPALGGHYKTSNTYVKVGTGMTGVVSRKVQVPTGVQLTVVTQSSN
jgi:hypothetical protein